MLSSNTLDTLNLESLEELDLSNSNISSALLSAILANAPNLKILTLSKCSDLNKIKLDTFNLESLEELDLSILDISSASLEKILVNASKLKKLNLSNCNNLQEEMLNTVNLASLEVLILERSNINSASLGKLLAKADKLKTLDLSSCYSLKTDITETLTLASLEVLDLKNAYSINSALTGKLLAKASRLKILDLHDTTLEWSAFDPWNLASLETLDLTNSNITSASLTRLLAKACKLKSLFLDKCKNLQEAVRDALNLESLETLDLSNSSINSTSVKTILLKAKRLKELDLHDCNNLKDTIGSALNLESLEDLQMGHTPINSQSLKNLLAKSSLLKSLSLYSCKNLQENIPEAMHFSSLEYLSIENANIHPALAQKLKANIKPVSRSVEENADSSKEIDAELMLPNTSQSPPYQSNPRINTPKTSLDADTTLDPDNKLSTTKLFYAANSTNDPKPSLYRLDIYHDIKINPRPCDIEHAFTLKNKQRDLDLHVPHLKQSHHDLYETLQQSPYSPNGSCRYYGKEVIQLSSEWQALASLSPHEILTDYHVTPSVSVEIRYSTHDNRYYLRKKPGTGVHNAPITIDFILTVPKPYTKLPPDIEAFIEQCQHFQAKPLTLEKPNPTGMDYLNALKKQQVGACRHRSLVFKDWMNQIYPDLPVRIITNDFHSFIEVYYDNQWVSVNLGGYPAIISLNEPHLPVSSNNMSPGEEISSTPAIIQLTAAGICEAPVLKKTYFPLAKKEAPPASVNAYLKHLLTSQDNKQLLKLSNTSSIAGLRYHLQDYCKQTQRPCFYIHSPEDLICSAPYIERQEDNTGKLKKGPGGPLQDFLTQHAQDEPLLIINYDQFSASDIVRFNALLDDVRKADGTPLPQ